MTAEFQPRPSRDLARRRRGRHTVRNRILLVAAVLIAFAVGVALGQALHDNPRPGGEQTSVRTFPPLTQGTVP